jgi:hypothetical protein
MFPEFRFRKFPSARMIGIITMNLCMTFKAYWYCIIDLIRTAFITGLYVVGFHFEPTKTMADTTTSVTLN